MISHAVEDYLKAIYELQQADPEGRASTSALAEQLGFAPASVTGMIKKLAEERPKLVRYEKHHGVTLTPSGEKIALEVIRHHRLIELYLHETLGYSWDEVDAEAEKLEHVISEDFENRIADLLGNPQTDPHGDPIPDKNGSMIARAETPLSELKAGQSAQIVRVSDHDPQLLRYMTELGIALDARIEVADKDPFGGPMHVRVGGENVPRALNPGVTDHVFVTVQEEEKE